MIFSPSVSFEKQHHPGILLSVDQIIYHRRAVKNRASFSRGKMLVALFLIDPNFCSMPKVMPRVTGIVFDFPSL